ncbi:MerR family transcriptional regulator [Paenibacillus sp. GCM10023248]|uniref:MerR family transcriptional regulator n=1 Tax=Bacillales TaxID=1385 RepID=UPI0023794713|nr:MULTISPECIES: MerR family transcriptional regulator [Bacillales]MDD9265622.1 MerR family transcriptional regulator [Paenibacillus sp. MAHUQ-63]MDR6878862.1 DNA-binding transcriptional MerR regulator [Bacillus sp. 3255]
MEYTVQSLGKLAGVSTRTLRYYDEIGLLKPARINSSGYRIYGQAEVDALQQILFYRELGVGLDRIKEIVTSPAFNGADALKQHYVQLLDKRNQLDKLIANVEKTMASQEGRISMTNTEKFEGFKQQLIDENEKKYGQEIREKYGEDAVNRSNQRVMNMTQEEHDEVTRLANEVTAALAEAFRTADPASEAAQQAAHLHKQWLTYYWHEYSPEAHAGLAQMYVDDERFRAYYDANQPGTAEFLRDAIRIYTGQKR